MERHQVTPDNYYVVYDDGYASISPGKAFEDGYSEVVKYNHPARLCAGFFLPLSILSYIIT